MPEEINRIIADRVSHLLFTPSPDADANLLREGISSERIHLVGNVMVDLVKHIQSRVSAEQTATRFGVRPSEFLLVTLHRPANVDNPERLAFLLAELQGAADETPVLFAAHPRTKERLLQSRLRPEPPVWLIPPLGYIDTIALATGADAVVTDSGGLQVETSALGVPCVTMREVTEHEVTVCEGSNVLLGPASCAGTLATALRRARARRGRVPPGWDGRAAERIAAVIDEFLRAGATF